MSTTESQDWLTTAQLAEHGIKASKAKHYARALEQQGLARKVGSDRRGQWLFAPETIEYLKQDQRGNQGYKAMTTEQSELVRQYWSEHPTVRHVAKSLKIGWYTAARWLAFLELRPLTDGTMTNYASRGKGNDQ